jgi:hypothetical protein
MDVANAAAAHGGVMVDTSTRTDAKGRKYGWVVFRIPATEIPAMFAAAGSLGKLYAQKFDAVDNQSDYESLARRVDSLRRHEQRLDGILASPRHMRGGDILFLQERLFRADVDSQMLLQQREDLMSGAQIATVKVQMFEPGTLPAQEAVSRIDLRKWYGYALLRARHEFERSAARGMTGAAYAAVYAPIWIPLAAVVLLLLAILWRMRRQIVDTIKRPFVALGAGIANAARWLTANWPRRFRAE